MWENGIFAQQNSGTSEDKVSQGRINFKIKVLQGRGPDFVSRYPGEE